MKSAAHLVLALTKGDRPTDAAAALLFDGAPERGAMLQMLYREAFLDRHGATGPELHETWFTRANAAPIGDAWRAYVVEACRQGDERLVEAEVVAHLPTDGTTDRRYGLAWRRLLAAGKWLGEPRPARVERHTHSGEVRVCERVDGTTTVVKRECSRHPLDIPSHTRPHRVALHVASEGAAAAGATEAAVDTVRYKCVLDAETEFWRLSLISELGAPGAPVAPLPAIGDVERVLTNKDVDFGVALSLLRAEPELARTVLGIDSQRARVSWRVELEWTGQPSLGRFHRGVAAALVAFSCLLRGGDFASRPLQSSFVSVALMLRDPDGAAAEPVDLVERGQALSLALLGQPADRLCGVRRPHELAVGTLAATVGMAVTAKDDGLACTLFVVPGGLAWVDSAERWGVWRSDQRLPAPAVLSAELMPDGTLSVNDCWVLPGHRDAWQCADLMRRCREYTEYVGQLAAAAGPAVRLRAKPWFYTPDDDVADLAAAIAMVLDDYPGLGLAADGLIFCSLWDGLRQRTLLKFKPVLTVDLLASVEGVLAAVEGEAQLAVVPDVAVEPFDEGLGVICEFSVHRGRRLRFVKARPDKAHPNLLRAAEEMFATEETFGPHRGGLDLMLRLRNGARSFRHATNQAKRAVLTACAGHRVFVDLGIGADVRKYSATEARKVVGLDVSERKLTEARARHGGKGFSLLLFHGDMNDPEAQARLRGERVPGEPTVVVANWTLGYAARDLPALLRFVASVTDDGGQMVGIMHFFEPPPADAPRRPDGPPVYAEDGSVSPVASFADVPVGAVWTAPLPSAALLLHWGAAADAKTLTCWKPTPYVVIGHCRPYLQWVLLDATAPNYANSEYMLSRAELEAACAEVGLELDVRDVPGLVPRATTFRAFVPRVSLSPLSGSSCYLQCPVPPLDEPLAPPALLEPLAVPAVGQVAWTVWVTRRGLAVLFHPDGRRYRVHGLLRRAVLPPCVLRAFVHCGRVVPFDLLQLHGRTCADEPFRARHALLRRAIGDKLPVSDVYEWDDLAGLAAAPPGVGRLYLAANRRACCPPLHWVRASKRPDLLLMRDGGLVRDGAGRSPEDRSPTPLVGSREEARVLRALTAADRQAPGGVVDTVHIVAPVEAHAAARRWARLCGCRHTVVEAGAEVVVRALQRPRRMWSEVPVLPSPVPLAPARALPCEPGVRAPWVGDWDRRAAAHVDDDGLVLEPREWTLLLQSDFVPSGRVYLHVGDGQFDELVRCW